MVGLGVKLVIHNLRQFFFWLD